MYRRLMAIGFLLVTTASRAVDWAVSITNTNTPVQDSDVQSALSAGMSAAFATTFPGRQYGVSVLLDGQTLPTLNNADVVYLALGLSHRLQNGALELPVGRLSEMLVLPQGRSPEEQREAVRQKLTAMAGSFSKAMMQNKPAFDRATAGRSGGTGDWTDWPDYHPGPQAAPSTPGSNGAVK